MHLTPPKSVVVIHGVGALKEEDTVRDLSRAIGRSLRPDDDWPPPMLVTKVADVRCDARDGAEDEAFTVTEYEVAAIGPDSSKAARRLPVYEFYWANLSRTDKGLLGDLRQSWQCLVGLPRIGFHSLTTPGTGPAGRALTAWVQATFGLAWVLIVVRLLASLLLILAISRLAAKGELKDAPLRYYDVMFILDLATYTALLAYAALRFALQRVDREVGRYSYAAGLTLAITLLLTQSLPLTILEFTGLDAKANSLTPWYTIAAVPPGKPPQSYGPPWFYYTNSLPGFIPYLIFGAVALWAIVAASVYGFGVRGRAVPPGDLAAAGEAERRMARTARWSGRFWRVVTLAVLVATPLVWWAEFFSLRSTGKSLLYLYVPSRDDSYLIHTLFTNPAQALFKNLWISYITYLMLTAVWVILTVPVLRRETAPLLELFFDLSNYFPPVPVLDDHPASRVLLGGRRHTKPFGSLRKALKVRLREVLQHARAQHGGPVCIVAHSLGTIIALSALDDWARDEDGPWVDLVTLGSPFDALVRLFPHLYGRARKRGGWTLPAVRRWLNLYRAGDPIGRRLDFAWAGDPPPDLPENEAVGNGGHLDYFNDTAIAARLARWLRPAHPPAAPSATEGTPA